MDGWNFVLEILTVDGDTPRNVNKGEDVMFPNFLAPSLMVRRGYKRRGYLSVCLSV